MAAQHFLELPLFPLNTVLYPGGQLQLRIFEPRYLDLICDCARSNASFGVCLILEGTEEGIPAQPADVGTLAQIVDFTQRDDGLLGIVIKGGERFSIENTSLRGNGLLCGEVELWPNESNSNVPVEFALLQTILERLIETAGPQPPWRQAHRSQYEDASWLSFRLAELLPLAGQEQQQLLEMTDSLQRLAALRDILPRFQQA